VFVAPGPTLAPRCFFSAVHLCHQQSQAARDIFFNHAMITTLRTTDLEEVCSFVLLSTSHSIASVGIKLQQQYSGPDLLLVEPLFRKKCGALNYINISPTAFTWHAQ